MQNNDSNVDNSDLIRLNYANIKAKPPLKNKNIAVMVDISNVDFLQNLCAYFQYTNNCNVHIMLCCPSYFKTSDYVGGKAVHREVFSFDEYYAKLIEFFPKKIKELRDILLDRGDNKETWFSGYIALVYLLIESALTDCHNQNKPTLYYTVSFNETSPFSEELCKFELLTYKNFILSNVDKFVGYLAYASTITEYEAHNIIVRTSNNKLTYISESEYMDVFSSMKTIVDVNGSAAPFNNDFVKGLFYNSSSIELVGLTAGVFEEGVFKDIGFYATHTRSPLLKKSCRNTINQACALNGFREMTMLFTQLGVPIFILPNDIAEHCKQLNAIIYTIMKYQQKIQLDSF